MFSFIHSFDLLHMHSDYFTTIISLNQVVDRYLKPDGVFYEVLSEDRDGVSSFLEIIQSLGFTVECISAPLAYYKNFNTRAWSHQVCMHACMSSLTLLPCSDLCV